VPTPAEKKRYMTATIRLARKGRGMVSPNPLVGAVIVKGNKIVGSGYHHFYGGPHAEVYALKNARARARGADLYINLEPCCHHGKTPPCTDVLIKSGIRRVFIGITDPNPLVSGRGIRKLRKAGIEVETGILQKECRLLNEAFIKYITQKIPFAVLKLAATLDGKIATSTGDSRWISCDDARRLVHRLRSEADAVLVGSGTVLADDPQLTVRHHSGALRKNPVRIIVDSRLRTPLSSQVLRTAHEIKTIIATTKQAPKSKIAKIKQCGAEVVVVSSRNNRVDLKRLMRHLAAQGIAHVLIEGGSELSAAALHDGIVDKVLFFYAPKIIGGAHARSMVGGKGVPRISDAISLADVHYKKIGKDILVEGYIDNRRDNCKEMR
jgi:diaminohydroxyphosphoribosylaminopyrimidine deaminase/5-amino-6-(5-phosphoribosylamino)uracil reductase